nr:nuclear speckle splicing regulatory protein,coiled coil domain containing protein [Hymenolepis microstoma]
MSLNNITGNQYGPIIPNKKPTREPPKIVSTKNVFGEESEDEEDAKFKRPTFDVKMETLKASLRKSTKINLEKALEEDASIFQYDEVYDKITREKEHKISEMSMPAARKSKYVNKLLEVSAVRKLEKELHNERKAQRELEAEKEKYADKESFVTGAYKAKMAELRELVEKRRQEEAIEDVMDITKQDGLGGFYRYMYEQKTYSEPISKSQDVATEKDEKSEKSPLSKRRSPSPHSKYRHEDDRGRYRPSSSRTRKPSSPPRYRGHRTESSRRSVHVRHRPDKDKHASSSSHHRRHSSSPEKNDSRYRHFGFNDRKNGENRRKDRGEKISTKEVEKKVEQSPPPPGFILAKPRQITDEEIQEARKRYLARKSAGLNRPTVVHSDDE